MVHAMIVIGADRVERIAKAIPRIHIAAVKTAIVCGNRMDHIIVIDPGDFCAGRHGKAGNRKHRVLHVDSAARGITTSATRTVIGAFAASKK